MVIVRFAGSTRSCRNGVYRLSSDGCNQGGEKERELHLGDLVVTEICRGYDFVSGTVPKVGIV